jgi:hypothetical protein
MMTIIPMIFSMESVVKKSIFNRNLVTHSFITNLFKLRQTVSRF